MNNISNIFQASFDQIKEKKQFQNLLLTGIQGQLSVSNQSINNCYPNLDEFQPCYLLQLPQHQSLLGIIRINTMSMYIISLYDCSVKPFKNSKQQNLLTVKDINNYYNIAVQSQNMRNYIVKYLSLLINSIVSINLDGKFTSYAMKNFVQFNVTIGNTLNENEIKILILKLGINSQNVKYYLELFKNYRQFHILNIKDYCQLINLLQCKPYLYPIFCKYCPELKRENTQQHKITHQDLQPIMSIDNFKKFLLQQQFQTLSKVIQQQYSSKYKSLSFCNFCKYLISSETNSIMQPITAINNQQTLSHYFVNSSHNTYLTGNQLTSDSKASLYYKNLMQGIRCLELDIHNGSNQPIIKHGYTLTKKITFQQAILSIKQFTQEYVDHTPIILSFENHCNQTNQQKITSILLKHFPMTYFYRIDPCGSNRDQFPKLKDLMGKIIIQGVGNIKIMHPKIQFHENNEKRISFKRYSILTKIINDNKNIQLINNTFNHITLKSMPKVEEPNEFKKKKNNFNQRLFKLKQQKVRSLQEIEGNINNLQNIHMNKQLSKIFGVTVSEMKLGNTCWEMANIAENKIEKMLTDPDKCKQLVQYSQKSLIRVYPFGLRFGSSNFNVIPLMQSGAQLISLNTQNQDIFSGVMRGQFLYNNNCGYVLKSKQLLPQSFQKGNKNDNLLNTIMDFSQNNRKINFQIKFFALNNLQPVLNIDSSQMTYLYVCFIGSQKDMKNNCKLVLNGVQQASQIDSSTVENICISEQFQCRCLFTKIQGLKQYTDVNNNLHAPPKVNIICQNVQYGNLYLNIPKCGSIGIPLKYFRRGFRSIPIYSYANILPEQMGSIQVYVTTQS